MHGQLNQCNATDFSSVQFRFLSLRAHAFTHTTKTSNRRRSRQPSDRR